MGKYASSGYKLHTIRRSGAIKGFQELGYKENLA
jgi:hypothetical protein